MRQAGVARMALAWFGVIAPAIGGSSLAGPTRRPLAGRG
jgi:hypothetical protein